MASVGGWLRRGEGTDAVQGRVCQRSQTLESEDAVISIAAHAAAGVGRSLRKCGVGGGRQERAREGAGGPSKQPINPRIGKPAGRSQQKEDEAWATTRWRMGRRWLARFENALALSRPRACVFPLGRFTLERPHGARPHNGKPRILRHRGRPRGARATGRDGLNSDPLSAQRKVGGGSLQLAKLGGPLKSGLSRGCVCLLHV